MGTSGKAREPRPEGYTGEPRGDSGRGLNHSLPTASQCPGFGKELGASHLLLQGRVSVGGVCAGGTPAPASEPHITTTTPQHHHHHHTQKKLDTF